MIVFIFIINTFIVLIPVIWSLNVTTNTNSTNTIDRHNDNTNNNEFVSTITTISSDNSEFDITSLSSSLQLIQALSTYETNNYDDYDNREEGKEISEDQSTKHWSQPKVGRTKQKFRSCGKICKSFPFDTITPLPTSADNSNINVDDRSGKQLLFATKDRCLWIYDINGGREQSQMGWEHQFMFNSVEGMFAIPVGADMYNITVVFTSGLTSQTLLYDIKRAIELEHQSHPFPGLTVDTTEPVDNLFMWLTAYYIYFIQDHRYYAYDFQAKRQLPGYPRNLTDFGLNTDDSHGRHIGLAFAIKQDIYFLTDKEFAIYSVTSHDRQSGRFEGQLGPYYPIDSHLIKCRQKSYLPLQDIDLSGFDAPADIDDYTHRNAPWIIVLFIIFVFVIIGAFLIVYLMVKNNHNKPRDSRLRPDDRSISGQNSRKRIDNIDNKDNSTAADTRRISRITERPIGEVNDSGGAPGSDNKKSITIYSSGHQVVGTAIINVSI